jgi:TolB-like protein/Tfp pilus assembly protein PilF
MAGDVGKQEPSGTQSEPLTASVSSGATRSVFLSYASHDAAIATSVCQFLENHGVSCWMAPRDVKPGAQYADAIVRAINEARALVLVMSASAVDSAHVAREVERAASKRKQIIPFRIDGAALNPELEYFLSNSQWIDVPALGMPAALAKLVEAVGQGWAIAANTVPLSKSAEHAGGRKRFIAIAAALIGVGAAVLIGSRVWTSRPEASASLPNSGKSIAVLPFVDLSQKHDQEYFGDGMSEEILDLLAKIPGLTVIGRTSSFQFKGRNEDLRAIGAKLNAAHVLEGSVRTSGDQIRVTTQLINTQTGTHEWSETYDRHIGDVLKLQDAIAAAIVRELQLTVVDGQLNSRPTLTNLEAYDLVLRGRHAADRWDQEGAYQAITLFQEALDHDPTSADAAAALAYTYEKLGAYGALPAAVAFEKARRATELALRYDPQNSVAHLVLGKVHLLNDWDWLAAERELRSAAALAPGSADPLIGEARLSTVLGRCDEALRQIEAALVLDPMNPNSFDTLWWIQACRGHWPEAEAAMRRALEIRPTYGLGHYFLGLTSLERADYGGALSEMQKEPIDMVKQQGLIIIYHALGRKADSDGALAGWLKEEHFAYSVAQVYAFRSQPNEAFRWLEQAYSDKSAFLPYLKTDLLLRSLQADSRFKAFLKKMNLPE